MSKTLVLLYLATCCYMQQVAADRMMEVEDFLVSQVKGDDITLNLKAVKESSASGKITGEQYTAEELDEFKTFLDLGRVPLDQDCTTSAYEILDKAREMIGDEGPSQKVRRIFKKVAINHAKHCAELAESIAEKNRNSISKATVKHVNAYTEAAIRSIRAQNPYLRDCPMDKDELIIFLKKEPVSSVWGTQANQNVYPLEVLKSLLMSIRGTTDDVGSIEALERSKLAKLYKDWIVDPCQEYIGATSEFFNQWQQISKYIRTDTFEYTNLNYVFYRSELCRRLVLKDDEKLLNALDEAKEDLLKSKRSG